MKAAYGVLIAAALLAGCQQRSSSSSSGERPGTEPPPVDVQASITALGGPANAETKALYAGEFEAVGAEPFWRLDLLNDWTSFTRPGLPEAAAMPGPREVRAQGALVVAGPLVITLRAGACEHESGETFPYKAKVDYEGVAYEGCARRATAGAGGRSGWTAALSGVLPAIDACLKRVEHPPGRVTIAYETDPGQASVRLLDEEGGRYECSVNAGQVSYWGAIGDRDVMDGEREPLFTRAPAAPPQGDCLVNEEAKDAAGTALGWYSRKTC